ncbi:hypothetical protein BKA08_002233 [Nocardioides marinisabuli]|uniref:DUF2505 domain-containing protein n=1 Tax=Nocardioides marinisabuli TaxID=419476 RepID=A0A7Y9F3D1_9ACTN|nr:DUF2505 domain-containing protein [Nocardioides marinisabuli]NYD57995.1 hypothetical protein [Nocardioides marinisabuli]
MSKRLVEELAYDAPLAAVAAMLADPAFREEVCERQRVLRHDVRVDSSGDVLEVRVEQVQDAAGVPSFAKKLIGDEITIVQEERWTGPEAGEVTMTIPGKPGDMRGTITLVERDGVTTETVDLTVKVSIPLVGGKVEGLVTEMLRKALRVEHKVGRDYLSR